MRQNLRPRLLFVQLRRVGLFVEEVSTLLELTKGDFTAEAAVGSSLVIRPLPPLITLFK